MSMTSRGPRRSVGRADHSRRHRRAYRTALFGVIAGWAAVIALLVVGLTIATYPQRTLREGSTHDRLASRVAHHTTQAAHDTSHNGHARSVMLNAVPASLSFALTVDGATAAETVTVTDSGTRAAIISKVAVTGDFSQTNNCGSIAADGSCEVTVTFRPSAPGPHTGTLTVASNASDSPRLVALSGTGIDRRTNDRMLAKVNLALGKPTSASGYTETYVPSNAVDRNTSTYWESTDNAFPQWLQVDLGAKKSFSRIVIDLPPLTIWATRTQTLSVLRSDEGSTFTTIVKSARYTFNPSAGNTVTITFPAARARYVRLYFTANTGWPAGQASEFQVWTR